MDHVEFYNDMWTHMELLDNFASPLARTLSRFRRRPPDAAPAARRPPDAAP